MIKNWSFKDKKNERGNHYFPSILVIKLNFHVHS